MIVYAKITVGRSVVSARAAERVEDVAEVVAAEVAHERRDLAAVAAEEPLELQARRRRRDRRAASPARRPRSRRRATGTARSASRRSGDSRSSPPSCCARLAQATAVLELDHLPAARPEVRLELGGADSRDHAVERLPVQVDDPEDVPEPARQRLGERLPDVPLVELRVAEQRDEAAAGRGAEARLREAVGERAEERRGGAEADRPGRVVDRERVLRPRRVGLQARRSRAAASGRSGRAGPRRYSIACSTGRGVRLDGHAVLGVAGRRGRARSSTSPSRPTTPDGRRP